MPALLEIASQPGPVEVTTVVSAEWQVDREGLINLDHPRAQAAHLTKGKEDIVIYFHALAHPTRGLYLIDTGVERAFRDHPDQVPISGMVKSAMNMETLKVRQPLGDYLANTQQPLRGIFFTHLHLDHLIGLRDVAENMPLFVGPGESRERSFLNLFVQGTANTELEGKSTLQEWAFVPSSNPQSPAVIDVFGDTTVWAIWVPGHTAGSVAYLARTPKRPILFTGDACHTRWGWDNEVEPGSFSSDIRRSRESLHALKTLAAGLPNVQVRLGHQP